MDINLDDIIAEYDYVLLDTNPYRRQVTSEEQKYIYKGSLAELTIDQLKKIERDQKRILEFYKKSNIYTVENVLKELETVNEICTQRLANFTGYINSKIRVNNGKQTDQVKHKKNIAKAYKKIIKIMKQTSSLVKDKIIKPNDDFNLLWEELKGISKNYEIKQIREKESFTDEQIMAAAMHLNKSKNVSVISSDYDLVNIYIGAVEYSTANCVLESFETPQMMDFFIANQKRKSYNFFEKSTLLENVKSDEENIYELVTEVLSFK